MTKDPCSQNVQMHVPPGAKQNGHGLTGRTAVRNGQDHIFLDAIKLESDVPDTGRNGSDRAVFNIPSSSNRGRKDHALLT
jgi:hypothetical protein